MRQANRLAALGNREGNSMLLDKFFGEGRKESPDPEQERHDDPALAVPVIQRLGASGWNDPPPPGEPALAAGADDSPGVGGDAMQDAGAPVVTPAPAAALEFNDLLAKSAELDALIESRKTAFKTQAIAEMRPKIARLGITATDLGFTRPADHMSATSAPKYRNPETGQTWTGRGRMPLWLTGKDRAAYLILAARA
jgi:DNA-binding protein H-NS